MIDENLLKYYASDGKGNHLDNSPEAVEYREQRRVAYLAKKKREEELIANPPTEVILDYYKSDNNGGYLNNSPEANEFREKRKAFVKAKREKEALANRPKTLDNGKQERHYTKHEPTLGDRGLEFTQGLAGGVGSLADLASNYVASPIISQLAKPLRAHSDISKNLSGNDEENITGQAATALEGLSDKYWNQNLAKDLREADILKTKNRDSTASALRGAGEFVPDLIPANFIGKGAKIASTAVHGANALQPAVRNTAKGIKNKVANWLGEPKLPKLANALETPLTKTNAAGFAGAGAAHGAVSDDNNEAPWYTDVPAMIGGTVAGAGLAGGAGSLGKSVLNKLKGTPEPLSWNQKRIINKINSGDNTLDEDFLNAAKDSNIDLNAFNIYKENDVPFKLAKANQTRDLHDILPNMKNAIYDDANKVLDDGLVKYDANDSRSEIGHAMDNLKSQLENAYRRVGANSNEMYNNAAEKLVPGDKVLLNNTLDKAGQLINDTSALAHGNSSAGEVRRFAAELMRAVPKDGKVPVDTLNRQKKIINNLQKSKTLGEFNLDKDERDRLRELKHAIDADLLAHTQQSKDAPNRDWFRESKEADRYFSQNVVPFRENKLFKNFVDNTYNTDTLNKTLRSKGTHDELENLLNIKGIVESKKDPSGKLTAESYDQSKADIDWIKRLLADNELFGSKDRHNFSLNTLRSGLKKATSNNQLYRTQDNMFNPNVKSKNISRGLRKAITPLITKYDNVLLTDKKHRSGLNSYIGTPEHSRYDISKDLPYLPNMVGAAAGSTLGNLVGTPGYAIGAVGGAAAGGAIKKLKSVNTIKNLSDKKLVNELIRLGRLPKEEKSFVLEQIKKYPALRMQMLDRFELESDDNQLNP